jgi:hypothetical protein
MNRFLFVFGYETPHQYKYNTECGTDDEDSIAFFVDAPDEPSALRRGRELAADFARYLFAAAGMESPWTPDNYANWIEHHPLQRFSGLALETLQIVGPNDTPDFDDWAGFGGKITP